MMASDSPYFSVYYILTPRLGTGHQVKRPALLGGGDHGSGQVAGNSLNENAFT